MKKHNTRKANSRVAIQTAQQSTVADLFARYSNWIVAILITLTVAAYVPAMTGGLVWDDDANITKPELQSVDGLYRIWFDPSSTAQYYPLVHTMFWLEHKVWGDAVLGYHLVNVIWHSLSVVLVYSILKKLKIPGALFAAAIFALHPVMVESVAWITEQKNTLSAVFYLSAMSLYLTFDQTRSGRQYLGALGFFALALATKTAIVTLPVSLLVIIWWQQGELSMKRDFWPLVPFFMLGVCAGLVTIVVERKVVGAEGVAFELTVLQRSLLASRVIWFYLAKLLWPANLTFIYPHWTIEPSEWWQWVFPIATILVTAVLWAIRRRSRVPLAGWLYFCATLFPVMGFLNVYYFNYSFVADHFQYLASLGVIVPVAAWLTLVLNRSQPGRRRLGRIACAASVAVLAVLTMNQCKMFGNVVELYRTTIHRNPDCWMAYNNLGNYLTAHGHESEAEPLYREAIRLRPDYPEALMNLGFHVSQMGRFDEAIELYKRSLAAKPTLFQAELDWGNTLVNAKRPQEAVEHFQAAALLQPKSPLPEYNLGNLLRNTGDAAGSIEHYKRSLQLKPDFVEAHFNFGLALAQSGQMNDAVDQFLLATKLRPEFVDAHQCLGLALVELKRDEEAVPELRRTLRLNPKFFVAKMELAKAYARLKRPEDAIAMAKDALATARENGQLELANGIEDWLAKYRTE
jgi:tetratricopeptide (TPR) repeat protein